jgi:hypothetical protein
MREVVLAALLRVVLYRWAHGGRGHGERLAHHPVGARPFRTEPHEGDVFVGNASEYLEHHLGSEFDGDGLAVALFPLGDDGGEPLLLDFLGLHAAAAAVGFTTTSLDLAGEGEYVFPAGVVHVFERVGVGVLGDEQFATFETDTSEDLDDRGKILNIIHWFRQLDVSEVARRFEVVEAVGKAHKPRLKNAHTRIEEAANNRLVIDIGVSRGDFGDGGRANLVGRQDGELDPQNFGRNFGRRHGLLWYILLYLNRYGIQFRPTDNIFDVIVHTVRWIL